MRLLYRPPRAARATHRASLSLYVFLDFHQHRLRQRSSPRGAWREFKDEGVKTRVDCRSNSYSEYTCLEPTAGLAASPVLYSYLVGTSYYR